MIGLLLLVSTSRALADHPCSHSVERGIINSVLNNQFLLSKQWLAGLDLDSALVPSKSFYRGLIDWKTAMAASNEGAMTDAVALLASAIATLQRHYDERQSLDSLAALAIAQGHFTRILLDIEAYTEALSMGTRALKSIEQYLRQSAPDHPARIDVDFLAGLRDIYLSGVPDELTWLVPLDTDSKSLSAGESRLEAVVQHSAVFATEAARALLMESPWALPRVCARIPLARKLVESLPENAEISVTFQGLLLKCGRPDGALEVNTAALEHFSADDPTYPLLIEGRYRALADLQMTTSLLHPNGRFWHLEGYRLLALGNALELSGQSKQARSTYEKVLLSTSYRPRILERARLRLRVPYTKPRKVTWGDLPEVNIHCSGS